MLGEMDALDNGAVFDLVIVLPLLVALVAMAVWRHR